jgi:hypothetical protein
MVTSFEHLEVAITIRTSNASVEGDKVGCVRSEGTSVVCSSSILRQTRANKEVYCSKNGEANATKNNKDDGEGVKDSGHGGGLVETAVTTAFVKTLNQHVLSKLTLKKDLSFLISALLSSAWKNGCPGIIN